MARHKAGSLPESTALTADEAPGLAVQVAAANALALEHQQRQAATRAVALQVGYQLPADAADPDLIQRDIAANMRRSVEACLEVGRGLCVLKAACSHGEFIARLDVLGIDHSVSKRFMQSARKFSNGATSHHLTKAIGNQSKLFEMLILDDEQIEELELTGQSGELKLDDIAAMSVKELRAALREARDTASAKSRVIEDKNARIDELTEKLIKQQQVVVRQSAAEVGAQLRGEVVRHFSEAEVELRRLRADLAALADHQDEHGVAQEDFAAGLLCQLERVIDELRGEFGIPRAPRGEARPEWLGEVDLPEFGVAGTAA